MEYRDAARKREGVERRMLSGKLELRKSAAGASQIVGRAVVYGVIENGERMKAGVFAETLASGADIFSVWNHDNRFPLGRMSNGTLELIDGAEGLDVVITPNPDTSWGRDALASVARGDVKHFSFGMRKVTWEPIPNEEAMEVVRAELVEVSPVTEPWYESTSAAAREKEGAGERGDDGGAALIRAIEGAVGRCEIGTGSAADVKVLALCGVIGEKLRKKAGADLTADKADGAEKKAAETGMSLEAVRMAVSEGVRRLAKVRGKQQGA